MKLGQKMSEESKRKLSESAKKRTSSKNPNWRGGDAHCIDCGVIVKRSSVRCHACHGIEMITLPGEYRKNPTCIDCGKKLNNSRALRCQKHAKTGELNGFYGKQPSDENKRILGARSASMVGKDAYNWKGGKSFEIYPVGWTMKLKENIRKRDNHKCQLCYLHESTFKEKLSVHHIDSDKYNIHENNLISLCRKCHVKTYSNRYYWEKIFKEKIKCKNNLIATVIL